jgi:hypothetical protein
VATDDPLKETMSLLSRLSRAFTGDVPADVIDHAPFSGSRSYDEKLKEAARKYAKPFKCAANGLPREIFDGRDYVTVDTPNAQPPAQPAGKVALKLAGRS